MGGAGSVRFGRLLAVASVGLIVLAGGCDDAEKERLRADNAALQAQSQKLTDQLAAAKAGKDAADADSKSLLGKLADATGKAESLLGQVAAAKALSDKAQAQYAEAVKKVTAMEDQAKLLQANMQKAAAAAAAKLVDSQKLASTARAEADSLKAQVTDLTHKVEDLTKALKAAQGLGGLLGPGQPPPK